MKKIGRNDPCPCGSGKKYKKCCGFSQQPSNIPIEVMKQIKKNKERVRKYGHVRPGISLNFHDYKMVAVGNQVHYCKKWKTFHDFLFDYIKNCLGQEWGKEELKKNISEMHPILQWYKEVCEFQKTNFIKNGEINSAVCTGVVSSYIALSYDLYILRHHSKLQQKLINRIKNIDQFQGARYELYVAASFIKAGYSIEFENEDDRQKSHCEFVATHKDTKKKYSIEAKSRHRSGFLGQKGDKQNLNGMRLRIGRLLNDALKKNADHERIIFIDVNLPPEEESDFKISWFKPLMKIIEKVEKDLAKKGKSISAHLFFTNHPAHYAGKEQIDPAKFFFLTAINIDEFKKSDSIFAKIKYPSIFLLWTSLNNHNHVPHEFEE